MRPASPTGLYWSLQGEVACATHAPTADDPRWTHEDWAPIGVADGRITGMRYQYQCQRCAPDGRAVLRLPE